MSGPPVKKARASDPASGEGAGGNQLLWLRQDLRLHDHPALCAAASAASSSNSTLQFVYIFSPDEDGDDLQEGQCLGALHSVLLLCASALPPLSMVGEASVFLPHTVDCQGVHQAA